MRSLISRLKRRRTSFSEAEPESPSEVFELQSVPDHKKRNHKPESLSHEKEETEHREQEDQEPVLPEPPAVILTTPEGLDIDTFAHGLMDTVDESSEVEDEWDTLVPPPLLAEPPKTPTKRRPAPPRPERPADLSLNTFVLGPPEDATHANDSETTLISPFADPQDVDGEGATSSRWSWSNSDASSDSSSDSESEEMDLQYTKHTAGKTLYAQLTDGFVSFPALSPDGSDDMAMKTFLDELDPDDVRDAEELLMDVDNDDGAANELIKAVASGESDWSNAFSRPVPRWLWLKSSNSFPVCRLGPTTLRHGHSKLRQAVSLVDEAGSNIGSASSGAPLDGTVEEVTRVGVVYL